MILIRPSLITKAHNPYTLLRHQKILRSALLRRHATHNTPNSSRKSVTLASDDGRIPWHDLSAGEKVIRSTQQSFNLAIILLGALATGGVAYFMYAEVFSTDSKTAHFNEAHARIRADPRCVEVLGDPKKIRAFGEATWNRWTRNRRIAGRVEGDGPGGERLRMHFNVEGPKGKGVVRLEMVRRKGEGKFVYRYLALDVPGRERIWLEGGSAKEVEGRKSGRMFGVKWW